LETEEKAAYIQRRDALLREIGEMWLDYPPDDYKEDEEGDSGDEENVEGIPEKISRLWERRLSKRTGDQDFEIYFKTRGPDPVKPPDEG
jgi:hypothetical protein